MGATAIPLNEAMKSAKMMKSICEVIMLRNNQKLGLGFFLNYSESNKYLIITKKETNSNKLNENEDIEIKGLKDKKIKLNLQNRFIKYIPSYKNLIIIEIKDSDELDKYFEFLDYQIIDHRVEIILIKNPFNNQPLSIKGVINSIINEHEFYHNISVNEDSLGCPIILLNNNMNIAEVIGIHKNYRSRTNGIFIKEIIKEMKNVLLVIKAEIYIEDKDINQDIRIINSYEEYMEKNYPDELLEQYHTNEEEIKKCQIEINGTEIPFSYFYKFMNKGKHTIKYTFSNNLVKANYMFSECSNLTYIDLSKFGTKEINNMSCMFANCCSLEKINLSNVNTEKVIDIGCMFYECNSLKEINLSSFNTKNVINMGCMFKRCNCLEKIDLSKFNTEKVIDMGCMFKECNSLKEINLSNFNTKNVINMAGIFQDCFLLTDINLSNFNTENTKNMNSIFKKCRSLTKINLSNFDTKKVTDMDCIFYECNSLKKENIITQDARIIQEFKVNIN